MKQKAGKILPLILIIIATAVIVTVIHYNYSPLPLPEDFTITAHSGSEGTPDNSMEFIEKSLGFNVPVIEIDVTFRQDGTPVMLHKDAAGDGEGVLLEEAFKYISENSDSLRVNLDLKSTANLPEVVRIVDSYGMRERCFYTGVKENFLEAVRKDGELPYYLNTSISSWRKTSAKELERVMEKVRQSGAMGINCNLKYASKQMVELFRENGLLVSYWTANNKKAMIKLLYFAPDNITTRNPLQLNEIKDNMYR